MNAKVHLLDYGYNMADYSIFIAGTNQGQRVKIPCMGCYIDHPEAKIVVDTGVSNPDGPGPPIVNMCILIYKPRLPN